MRRCHILNKCGKCMLWLTILFGALAGKDCNCIVICYAKKASTSCNHLFMGLESKPYWQWMALVEAHQLDFVTNDCWFHIWKFDLNFTNYGIPIMCVTNAKKASTSTSCNHLFSLPLKWLLVKSQDVCSFTSNVHNAHMVLHSLQADKCWVEWGLSVTSWSDNILIFCQSIKWSIVAMIDNKISGLQR